MIRDVILGEASHRMTRSDDLPAEPTKLEHEAYGWVVRFVSGEAGPDDIKALKAWSALSPAHAAAFDRASKVWQAAAPLTRKQPAENTFEIVRAAAGNGRPFGRPYLGRRAVLGGALAASAAGAAVLVAHPPLGLWPSWSQLASDYRTQTGEQRQITLVDRVSVDMNTRTSIAVNSAGQGARIELIAGEAMISTSPNASGVFTVLAADGRIVATDARFNVRCDDGSVCVTCLQGQVRVEYGAAVLPLAAEQQVSYADNAMGTAVRIDPAVATAWQSGIVIFDATPIVDVVKEVNRYRPGRIILTNPTLGREKFSARFRIANIGGVVGQIEQVFGVRTTALPGGIVLLG
jgi:transmembrane sensor